jgi:hypothetical protein
LKEIEDQPGNVGPPANLKEISNSSLRNERELEGNFGEKFNTVKSDCGSNTSQ